MQLNSASSSASAGGGVVNRDRPQRDSVRASKSPFASGGEGLVNRDRPQRDSVRALKSTFASAGGGAINRDRPQRDSLLVRASKSTFRRLTNFLFTNPASVLPLPVLQNDETPLYGVNVSFLRKVVEYSYDIDPTFEISCEEVMTKIVKPLTKETKVSMCSMFCSEFIETQHPSLDISFREGMNTKASVYMIYSRNTLFYDLYKSCESYVQENKRENQHVDDITFWIDIFSFNPWIQLTSQWYANSLPTIIKSIGKSCLLMIPSRSSASFSRTWCLYELYLSGQGPIKNPLIFQFNHDKQKMFMEGITNNFDYVYTIACGRITTIELSACASDVHKNQILSLLARREVNGFKGVDSTIEKYIVEQFADMAIEVLESEIDKIGETIEIVKENIRKNEEETKKTIGFDKVDITQGFVSIFIKKDKNDFLDVEVEEDEDLSELVVSLENKRAIASLSLGTLNYKIGLVDEAEDIYEQILRESSGTLSGTNPTYLAVLNNLAVIKKEKRVDVEAAIELFDKSLVGKEKVYGELHNSIIVSNINKAILHKQMGETEDALDLLEFSLSDISDIFGKTHPNTIGVIELLIQYNLDIHRKEEAIKYLRRSCDIQFECFGETHSNSIATYEALGSMLARTGKKSESIDILQRVLRMRDKSKFWGPRHQLTLDTCNRLGILKLDAGLLQEARDLFYRVYDECAGNPILSEDEKMCFESLADINVELRHVEDAEPIYRGLHNRFVLELGNDHEDTWRISFKFAECLVALENFTESERLHRFSYEKRSVQFGSDHMYTLESLFGLGNSLAGLFLFLDSQAVIEKAVVDYSRVYGPYDDLTIAVKNTLASIYSKLGLVEKTEEIYKDLIIYFKKEANTDESALKQEEYFKNLLHNLLYDYNHVP